jgi:hypothetical protein
MPKGEIVGKLVVIVSTLKEVHNPSEVMGVFEEVSKMVPL